LTRAADVARRAASEAQRRLLTAAVESTHDAVITTDRDGTITSWNSGAERLYGFSEQEMLGISIVADDRARGWLERVLAGDDVREAAVQRLRSDGQEIWVSVTAAPLREGPDTITGMAAIAREVTDQQRLLSQLAEAEERQRLLLASLPGTLVALYDRELRCQMLDGQMVRRTGTNPADYIGRPISETLAPEQYDALEPLIRRALEGESSSQELTSALSGITYELDVAPYRLPDGTIAGAFAVGRDLTERLDRSEQLRERERQLAEAQAIAHLGSWELDVAADRLSWSDELCRIAGQPLGSAPTVAEFLALIHPDDLHLLSGEVNDAITGHASRSEYRLVRPDGTVRHVLTTRDPRVDPDGRVTHLFGTTQDITERVEDERRLRQLAAVVEHTGEAITAKDADGNITEWNAGAQRLYGYTAEEMLGQPVTRLVPPERAGEEFELLQRAMAGETIGQLQTERLRRDGSRLEVSITVSPMRDDQGKPVGASIITRDVTAPRTAERARKRALAKMAEAQRIAGIGSWTWDTTADEASWSAEMYRLFGRDPILGPAESEQFFAYLHPHDRERVRDGYAQAFGGGGSFELDYRIKSGDGKDLVLNAHGRMERPGYYVGTVQDVTSLRAIEREAREAAELFRQTLEHAPIGIALVAPDGRWLNANRALCSIVGYSEAELLELSFQDITHPDDLDADLEQAAQLLAGEISGYRMEKRYFHKSGRIVQAELSVSLVRDEGGGPVHFISQIQDITAQHEAHEALVESERRYHSIAANVPGMVYRFALAPDGTSALRFASAGSLAIYGHEPDVVMADPQLILARTHPDDRDAWQASVAESAANLSLWEWSGRQLTPDGQVKYCRAVAQPFREPDGTIVWDGVISDETEVRLAHAEESETKQRLQTILENLAGSAVTVYDREQRLRSCEGPLFADADLQAMYGRPVQEIAPPETYALLAPGFERALAGEASSGILDDDSQGRSLAVHIAPHWAVDGSIEGTLVHWHDITPVRRAERERDVALERFQVAFERAPIGMVIIGLNGRFERVNGSLSETTGLTPGDFRAMAPFEVVDPQDRDRIRGEFARLGVETDTLTFEHRITHADGHPVWIQARVTLIRRDDGAPVHALAQVLDLTERRAYEKRLKELADHDPLSGLLNRRGFETALDTHLARCRRHGSSGALLALDLDGFKTVNDALGHSAGDDLIVSCAHALKRRLRETDIVARLGGDEFAVLLTDQGPDEAEVVARALVETIRGCAADIAGPHPGRVTVSIGVAAFPNPVGSADEMMTRADGAMYDAKQGGRDRYAFYSGDRGESLRLTRQSV
jgi:diguanylate cyclase (GGDEF)-like protein/PAS domain S-box-containing protein